ncbi:MAG: SAM-dependent methyltransferase [Actinomycetota bacterium]
MDDSDPVEGGLDVLLEAATAASFRGWDFAWVGDRYRVAPTDWDYRAIVETSARTVGSLVDMGTGGGEFLAGIEALPRQRVATESHPPNWHVAGERLGPKRIPVVAVESCPDNNQWQGEGGRLPLRTESVELVINRHDAYSPAEVARVLTRGGVFITQQVGGRDEAELLDWFDRPIPDGAVWSLGYATRQLEAAGMRVTDGAEADLAASFADVGALAYYLQAVPWQVPDFDIAKDRHHLARLHTTIENTGRPLQVTSHRFWLKATKPPPDRQ